MSILKCRAKYQSKLVSKHDYIEKMYGLHARLFEYSQFIQDTDIHEIAIKQGYLVIEMKNGIKFICDSLDRREAPFEILNFNVYEKKESTLLFKLLKPNMIFFDIGSNVGWYSLTIAKHDESINVYAFEPMPKTFNCLKRNILSNNIKNIFPYNFGFSNENKQLDFYFDPFSSGSASLKNILGCENAKIINSNLMKIDDFIINEKISHLDFIKCDVEGAELLVFQGAIKTLEKYKPIIFSEMLRKWSKKFEYHPNDIIQLLSQLGYRAFCVENDNMTEVISIDESTLQTNFFFLHAEKHRAQIDGWCI